MKQKIFLIILFYSVRFGSFSLDSVWTENSVRFGRTAWPFQSRCSYVWDDRTTWNVVFEPKRVRGERAALVCRSRTFYFPNFLFGTELISGEFFFRPPFHFSSLISGLVLDVWSQPYKINLAWKRKSRVVLKFMKF